MDNKKRFIFRMCGFLFLFPLIMTSCVNSHEESQHTITSEESGEEDMLSSIMKKYDHLKYEYSGEPVSISMCHWTGDGATIERQVIEAMLKGFNIRYPNIKVDLDILPDYESTYPSRLAAGNVHDVFMMPDGSFAAWAKTKSCLNLSNFIAASDLVIPEKMYQTSLTRYRYNQTTGQPDTNGLQLALPKDIGPMVMYYNKNAFDEMGVAYPKDDEIMDIEAARAMWKSLVKKNKNDVVTRYAVSDLSIEGLVWSAGGDFLNPERTQFPTEETTIEGLRKGYQFVQDAYVKDCIVPPIEFTSGSDGKTLFSQQRVACYIGLKSNVTAFRGLSFDWDVCPIPAFSSVPEKNGWSGSVGYSVFSKTKYPEAAWKLVEYISSMEGQDILSATGFQIPSYPEIGYSEDFLNREKQSKPHNVEAFLMAANNQPYGLWNYRDTQTWKVQGYDVTSELLFASDPNERWTVEEFLQNAKAKVNSYLG